jgi:hypothetical protein
MYREYPGAKRRFGYEEMTGWIGAAQGLRAVDRLLVTGYW